MTWFKNTSGALITIVYNGRKVKIERGGRIEGPPHFKFYKGLILDENNNQDLTTNIVNRLKPIVQQSSLSMGSADNNLIRIENTISHIKNYKTDNLPSIGICILTKNHLELIKDCCESIFDKVDYKNVKIYIFDTGSLEKSVWEYYKQLNDRKYPVQVIPMNYFHFSKNYNEGIKHVDTDYIVIQNNDTVAINDYVSKLMKVVIIDKVGTCGPRMLYLDGKIQHDGQHLYKADGTLDHATHVNISLPGANVPTGIFSVAGITGAGLFIKTDLYRKIGGFDENFKDIYQDVHFNLRMKALGYTSICDRNAQIYHYDNTSRKKLWEASNPDHRKETSKMAQDDRYLKELIAKDNSLRMSGIPKQIDFSIITLVNNKEQYLNLLEDLKNQKFNGSFEIVALPNFNNEYIGCSEALNIGKDVSLGKYCIYCHQDIRVPNFWLEIINNHIKELDISKVGLLGMSGASKPDDSPGSNGVGASYISEMIDFGNGKETLAQFFRRRVGKRMEVQTLDELCIISKRTLPIRFDEKTFDHYHWYGADVCMQALAFGLKNYAIDAECLHLSDGIGNFQKETHRVKFIEGAKALFNKWKAKYPHFRTTTTGFSIPLNQIQILFAKQLTEKYNIPFPGIVSP